MDAQKYHLKLTRTNSSLIRSSSSVRSSIHSLSSVNEISSDEETKGDLEEQKPHSQPIAPPVRASAACFAPVSAVLVLSFYAVLVFVRWNGGSTSEKLLLALIFVAFLLFFVSRNMAFVGQKFNFLKRLCSEHGKRFGLCCITTKNYSKPVQWYVGESNLNQLEGRQQDSKEISCRNTTRERMESYRNGDFYEGEFHEGRYNGSGVYHYNGSGRYEGDWVNGKYDGYGIESWARGSRYRGQYRQGMRHGFGVYKFFTGDAYAGEWCNGQSRGIGAQTCVDGSCYLGEFKHGVKHGLGCYHFRNGDRYMGEYFEDKIHGFGVYHFANGHCYEGSWHEGRRQGYGMYTFRNGETKTGEWDSGNLKTPLPPLSDSVLRAVQAARKAARDGILLRRVDEQVNKAVAAASRAASAAVLTCKMTTIIGKYKSSTHFHHKSSQWHPS